jgi:hypothetical protein
MTELEELLEAWKIDSTIDTLELGDESTITPKLHSKYVDIMSKNNLKLKRLELELAQQTKLKWLYYTGKLNGTDILNQLGWEPFQLKLMKSDIVDSKMIESDDDIVKLKAKMIYASEIVEACRLILSQIKDRTWQIRNNIEWKKFLAGN